MKYLKKACIIIGAICLATLAVRWIIISVVCLFEVIFYVGLAILLFYLAYK